MRHLCLKAKSAALYALPAFLLILLFFGSTITVAEASGVSATVIVEVSTMSASADEAVSDNQDTDQSWWDNFWSWIWDWNWSVEETEDNKKYKPQPMYGFAWSG